MILILVPKVTSRLHYSLKLMLRVLMGQDFRLTSSSEEFNAFQGIKFSYGPEPHPGLHFYSDTLLFETGIKAPRTVVEQFDGLKVLFPVMKPEAPLPFDPFAATFYMVSRYEEYLPYRKDHYGRFPVIESLAFREGFLDRPVVHLWAASVARVLKEHFPQIVLSKLKFKFIPTYDIDQAWAYLSKGILRTAYALLKNMYRGELPNAYERLQVLARRMPDPYDTYDYQFTLHRQYSLDPVYFILFARYNRYDRNIPMQSARFAKLILNLADNAQVGIHPSFASNEDEMILRFETAALSELLHREVTHSRQHFIKLLLPHTYRNLITLDITHDYSMGFVARPGFRAGICVPFPFYDLDLETETSLTVVPFTVMDGTLRDYMNLSPEEAWEVISGLIDEVRAVDGSFVSLWHNDSLSETGRWKGWRKVYEKLVQKAME